jgi:hypothetical protein
MKSPSVKIHPSNPASCRMTFCFENQRAVPVELMLGPIPSRLHGSFQPGEAEQGPVKGRNELNLKELWMFDDNYRNINTS